MTEPKAERGARTNRVGWHLPTSGELEKTLRTAQEQGLETIQIFVSNPQGWAVASITAAPTLTVAAVK